MLPNRDRRMIGAWCFVDHYGPEDISSAGGMWVPPHPHTGLQTVSWLLSGEIRHRDSLGNDAVVRPGQLNLMTAGPGIAHAEESPAGHSALLHGLQLWVALPSAGPGRAPLVTSPSTASCRWSSMAGLTGQVVTGELVGQVAPAPSYSPLAGRRAGGARVAPSCRSGPTSSTGCWRSAARSPSRASGWLRARSATSVEPAVACVSRGHGAAFLLGGEPFAEKLVMWWNFIGRSHEEIVAFRQEWNSGGGERFGPVEDFDWLTG